MPYMLIVGDREEKENNVAVRTREGVDMGAINMLEFLKIMREAAPTG